LSTALIVYSFPLLSLSLSLSLSLKRKGVVKMEIANKQKRREKRI